MHRNPQGFRFVHGTQGWVGPDGLIYLWNPVGAFLGASSDRIIRFDPSTETFENLGDTPYPTALPLSAVADLQRDRVVMFGLVLPGYVWGSSGTAVGEVWQLSNLSSNQEPVADAGADQWLEADATCQATAHLDGGGSFDPDGDALTFHWTTLNGTANSQTVEVDLPLGTHVASLQVEDGRGGTASDEVVIQVVDATGPSLALNGPSALQVECQTPFVDPGATAADNCDSSPGVTGTGSVDPAIPGSYLLSYQAFDTAGNGSDLLHRTVEVVDTMAPLTTGVTAEPAVLWPPNHQMVPVAVSATASDSCSPQVGCAITSVVSNEAVNGGGDGNTTPDWEILGAGQVLLRAERSGSGSGRTYTLTVTCVDAAGNTSTGSAAVRVPKNQSGR